MTSPNPQPGPAHPGWYPDGQGWLVYFDGQQWTPHRRPMNGSPAASVTHPAVGWVLVVFGGLVAIGALLPWVTALGGAISRNGLDEGRDGVITLPLGLALVGVAVVIGVRRGLIWAPIVCGLLAAAAAAVFVADYNDINSRSEFVSVGSGLWLTGIAAFAAFITAIVGCFART